MLCEETWYDFIFVMKIYAFSSIPTFCYLMSILVQIFLDKSSQFQTCFSQIPPKTELEDGASQQEVSINKGTSLHMLLERIYFFFFLGVRILSELCHLVYCLEDQDKKSVAHGDQFRCSSLGVVLEVPQLKSTHGCIDQCNANNVTFLKHNLIQCSYI